MRKARIAIPVAMVAIAAMALTGCTTTGEAPAPSTATGGTITVAEVNELTSFNVNTPAGNLDMNDKYNGYTRSNFFKIDNKLNIVPDKSFGTMEKTSDDPLTVKYTLADGVKWSDGTPITSDDMMLAWAVQSGYFNDATMNADGDKVEKGNLYFNYAGDTAGLGLANLPEVSADKKSLTLTYTQAYADWQLVDLTDEPVHVVAEKAGITVDDLMKAFMETPRGNADAPAKANETIRKAADFWNKGFDATSLPSDKSLYLSSGPMVLEAWAPGQSITLVKNKEYVGDLVPKVDKIVIRFIGDAQAQVKALQNGEVDVINPQADADTIASLKGMSNATTLTGDQFSYDHLDLTFSSKVFKDKNVREAFLKTIPRQQIVDAIVKPQNPNAEIYNSQLFFPGSESYDQTIKDNGSAAYNKVDIEGAKKLLAGATPTVKLLYNTKNPNRVNAFQLIQASAEKAGFKIEDGGAENWGALLGSGTYDASIFGWISSGVGVAGVPQIFGSKGGGNYSGYANAEVDKLANQLQVTLDKKDQDAIQVKIDDLLWQDFYGVPLFVAPGVMAHSNNVTGVVYYPGQAGVGWNFWEWAKK